LNVSRIDEPSGIWAIYTLRTIDWPSDWSDNVGAGVDSWIWPTGSKNCARYPPRESTRATRTARHDECSVATAGRQNTRLLRTTIYSMASYIISRRRVTIFVRPPTSLALSRTRLGQPDHPTRSPPHLAPATSTSRLGYAIGYWPAPEI